eukprot:m.157269 g.157269  ORF g.157269 m.157269 type:complete len:254 (+) comp52950_c0_seq5:149-910(+)
MGTCDASVGEIFTAGIFCAIAALVCFTLAVSAFLRKPTQTNLLKTYKIRLYVSLMTFTFALLMALFIPIGSRDPWGNADDDVNDRPHTTAPPESDDNTFYMKKCPSLWMFLGVIACPVVFGVGKPTKPVFGALDFLDTRRSRAFLRVVVLAILGTKLMRRFLPSLGGYQSLDGAPVFSIQAPSTPNDLAAMVPPPAYQAPFQQPYQAPPIREPPLVPLHISSSSPLHVDAPPHAAHNGELPPSYDETVALQRS